MPVSEAYIYWIAHLTHFGQRAFYEWYSRCISSCDVKYNKTPEGRLKMLFYVYNGLSGALQIDYNQKFIDKNR